MIAWNRVMRAHVRRAIEDYDRLGTDRFFAEHGFEPITTYGCQADSTNGRNTLPRLIKPRPRAAHQAPLARNNILSG